MLTLHGCGTAWPLETAVKERKAIFAPLTSRIVERVDAFALRAVPACASPARSSARSVVPMPYWPASSEWFEAVLHASQPVALIEPRQRGRRAEARIALHGPGHERGLDMAEGQVRARRSAARIERNIGRKS